MADTTNENTEKGDKNEIQMDLKNYNAIQYHQTEGEEYDLILIVSDGNDVSEPTVLQRHQDQKHVCKVCSMTFNQSIQLLEHLKEHTEESHVCNTCKETFPDSDSLKEHKKTHRPPKKGNIYITCDESFSKEKLQEHTYIHQEEENMDADGTVNTAEMIQEESYMCNTCGQCFVELESLNEHSKEHGSEQCVYVICEDAFAKNGQMEESINTSQEETLKATWIINQEGNNSIPTEGRIIELNESESLIFYETADANTQLVVSNNDIYSASGSQTVHSVDENNEYKCEKCDKKFKKYTQLQKHSKTHDPNKPTRDYICEICGRSFSRNTILTEHRRTHTGERPYDCDICGRKFAQTSILQRHKRIHSGEHPYVCHTCGEKFTQSSGLHRHQRVHRGELFHCDICNKIYTRKTGLILHQRIHTGEKPYECVICGDKFSRSADLKKHNARHMVTITKS